VADHEPSERVRNLLLRGDNLLKKGDDAARVARAVEAFEEALAVAADPSVDPRVRELVERRLAAARDASP
jgi:predicted secreted Zn-dependent protease